MAQKTELVKNLPLQVSDLASGLILAGVYSLSFFVPFALGHPQWLVGTIVNVCLFLGAVYLPKRYFIALAVLPSLGVLARGVLFGSFTMFLVYFLPFIWIGNLLLVLTTKGLFSRFGYIFSAFSACVFKFLFLFIIANICFRYDVVPAFFLHSMGLNQLSTALDGGLVAFLVFKIYGQLNTRSKEIA